MNINEIKNETLHKLTHREIGHLDLCNYGVGLYRGELKTRYRGVTRKTDDSVTFRFEFPEDMIEFTECVSTEEGVKHWAARIFDKRKNEYATYPMGIVGCNFIR